VATDVILELGHDAAYLEHAHTLENFRGEYYYPRVTNREPRGVWESAGGRTIVEEARARVDELRALPTRTIVSDAQRRELSAIEKTWTAELT
jgi:trimethylamine:corrinoid methyltransferase-like protein